VPARRSTLVHCSVGNPCNSACWCSCFRHLLAAHSGQCLLSVGCRTDWRHDWQIWVDRKISDFRDKNSRTWAVSIIKDTASATNGSTYQKTEQISDILKTDTDTDVGVRNNENTEYRQLNTAKFGYVRFLYHNTLWSLFWILSTQKIKCDRIRFSRSAN